MRSNKADWVYVGIAGVAIAAIAALIMDDRAGQSDDETVTDLSFSFDTDTAGWRPGFADLPADVDRSFYDLAAEWRPLPDGLEGGGLYSQGTNRSDDLLMFWTAPITDLAPTTGYTIEWEIELATNMPSGMAGIGGSPTDAVFVKVGATPQEPMVEVDPDGFNRLNTDVGSQSEGGRDATVIGTLTNPNVVAGPEPPAYALMTLEAGADGLNAAMTDGDGRLWLFVGTDSGFEGTTTLYLSRIAVTLTRSSE